MTVSPLSGVRLTRKAEEFLTQILTELRKSGSSEKDIEKATAGLERAIFANSRINIVNIILRCIVGTIIVILLVIPPWMLLTENLLIENY
jgi:hypothetical protein